MQFPIHFKIHKTVVYFRDAMGSIACSSNEAPDGMARKLQRLFGQKDLNAQVVNPGVADCIAEAKDAHELHMVRHVMSDYKSSNFGPTRKRALAVEDCSAFAASHCDEPNRVPKNVDKLLTENELEVQAGQHIAKEQLHHCNSSASGEEKTMGLADDDIRYNSESTRQSWLSASISASQSITETGIAPLREHLVQLFKRPKLSCKDVTEEVASRITNAKNVGELSLIWNVMRDFKSNNIGPTRKRVLSLGDATEVATDLAQLTESMKQNAGVPKKLRCMLDAKEAQLRSGDESSSRHTLPTPLPTRQRSVAKSSRAAEKSHRGSDQPLSEQRGVENAELLGRLALAFGVEEDAVHKMRRHNDLFSLIDIATMVSGQQNPAQEVRRVLDRFPEVRTKCYNLKFPGRGQRGDPCRRCLHGG